jgi:RNA polymerase sigma-70 factor (ECF subfamily)
VNGATTWPVSMDQRKQHEEALLVTAAQSDPAAFADLYEHFLPIVYRYLLARLGSAEDAADLTQQVFTRALSALPGFKPNGPPFSAWLLRIARNAAIDASRRRHPSVQIEQIPADRHPVDLSADPEDLTLRREADSDPHAMLAGLNDEQRDLMLDPTRSHLLYEEEVLLSPADWTTATPPAIIGATLYSGWDTVDALPDEQNTP